MSAGGKLLSQIEANMEGLMGGGVTGGICNTLKNKDNFFLKGTTCQYIGGVLAISAPG